MEFLSPAEPLDALGALHRQWLYVFVAGPGQGEGIAVALPGSGWLLVDGCQSGGRFPLEEILLRWRAPQGDPVRAMVLTHPHEDHVEGFAELLEVLRPERVAVTAGSPPGQTLLSTLRALLGGLPGEETRAQSLARQVLAAVVAIEHWEQSNPGGLLGLTDGEVLLTQGALCVHARAPDSAGLSGFLKAPGLQRRLRAEANHISLVLELRFGNLGLLLTSDLPHLRQRGGPEVPTGWASVALRHPHLGAHDVLKIPHHGSAEAMHAGWMTARSHSPRAWLVTPYNSSALPELTRLEGLPRLLQFEPSVLLTAVPASKQVQAVQPQAGRVRLDQLVTRAERQKARRSFIDGGTDIRPGSALGPLDPVWCVAFDAQGVLRGRWRGQAALEVTC